MVVLSRRFGSQVRGRLCAASLMVLFFMGACAEAPVPAQTAASEPAIAQRIAASQDLLDINTATPLQLKALPGMGNIYVQRVIAGRPYTAKNQLTTRGILPQMAYDRIKDQIIAHRPKS